MGDVEAWYSDNFKVHEKLGWKPQHDLDDICRDLWNWLSKNPNGFSSKIHQSNSG